MHLKMPIGYDNFSQIITSNFKLVDKSLLIKEFLDDSTQVSLITRPRRFGKSLNLSMLRYFFAPAVAGEPTKGLFDNLKIAQAGEAYMQHQGQYPVIALTFKDIKASTFETAYAYLRVAFSQLFLEHKEILSNPDLDAHRKRVFEEIIQETANEATVGNALCHLTQCLYEHYGKKPILLIDEYDTPIQSAYVNGYYQEMIEFIRKSFSCVLKGNLYLHRAVLTGILRVSKESLFSGLNNVEVYSMFNSEYSEHFGFTEAEVDALFTESGLSVDIKDVRKWYNGYQIGGTVIYNPWSIVHCIKYKGELRPYWVNTASNDVLKTAIKHASATFKINMELLLQRVPIQQLVDENFVFQSLKDNDPALWSLLLASGYLKAVDAMFDGNKISCKLLVPNQEVLYVYEGIFKDWFWDELGQDGYAMFLKDLLTGNVIDFSKRLQSFLSESASQFDIKGKHPEKFYHGFVLGLMATLQKTHTVKSNRESGYGRYDLIIIPNDKTQIGIVLEFKTAEANEDLHEVAKQALQQVNDKQYETEVFQTGIKLVLKLGLAFKGKQVVVVHQQNY